MDFNYFSFLVLLLIVVVAGDGEVFDVMSYGAKGDGQVDDSKAFLSAWSAACSYSQGESTMLIPEGSYLVGPLVFQGYCSQNVTVLLKGNLLANTNPVDVISDSQKNWIEFKYIDVLNITGGGVLLNARGASSTWSSNDRSKKNCTNNLPKTLVLSSVRNASIYNISSINGESFHMNVVLHGSEEVPTFDSVVGITALEGNPNRDDDVRTLLEQLHIAGLDVDSPNADDFSDLLEMTATFNV